MSRFKSLLLCAGLLAGLLSLGSTGAAFAETTNAGIGNGVSAPRGPEQRVALVIGNSNYQTAPQLQNPNNDAQSMAQFLNSAGFEVTAATDLTQNDMIKVLQDFSAKVAARGPDSVTMSRMRIVVLDACRNNPFPTVNDAGRGLAIVDAPSGSIVGYSTAPIGGGRRGR